ncbi:MAG: sirohydrochlorin chelatase [Mariprofundaceae bacterium]
MFVLLAHGSSDQRHGEQVRALAAGVSQRLSEEVKAAFLSDEWLPKGTRVLPLFLGYGQHGAVDAPKLAEKSQAMLLPSLAAHADRIAELAYDRMTAEGRRVNALFGLYCYAGFEALNAALHERNKRCTLVAHGALHAEPTIASVIRLWREDGVGAIRLQPMLLFDGKSMDEMATMARGEDVEILPALSKGSDFAELITSLFKEAA